MVYLLAGVVVASLLTPGLFASTISPRALPNPLIHSAEEPDQLRSLESGESSSAGPQIIEVDPETLECDVIVTFDDIPGDWSPGTNYDNILQFSGASFAERFMGQALTFNGNFDVLSGTPSSPLTLQIGAPNQNLDVFRGYFFEYLPPTQVLAGIGPLGYPNFSGVGEGAFAALFDMDQAEVGFSLVGGDRDGTATVNFFRRNGSVIDTIVLTNLWDLVYGFQRVGGINDIAGISTTMMGRGSR